MPKQGNLKKIVNEETAGGVVWRRAHNRIEILLIQDSQGRWSLPKGHVEPGETYRQTAEREIKEETGLKKLSVTKFLRKVQFQYRRRELLVSMNLHIFLVQSLDQNPELKKEGWVQDIRWTTVKDAFLKLDYVDINKVLLLAVNYIRRFELSEAN